MHIERQSLAQGDRSLSDPPGDSITDTAHDRVKHLIDQACADGALTREEDERIVAALISEARPTAAMCALFRQLQERVWNGELSLGDK